MGRVTAASLGGHSIRADGLVFSDLADLTEVESCDLLCVPGGHGTTAAMVNEALIREIRRLSAGAKYVTSVCTGSLILAAAGLLRGKRAGCHWAWRNMLTPFGAIVGESRVVRDGNIITGGGVTGGLDFALVVAAEIADQPTAEAVQLALEYAPAPPFGAGRPENAPPRWWLKRAAARMLPCPLAVGRSMRPYVDCSPTGDLGGGHQRIMSTSVAAMIEVDRRPAIVVFIARPTLRPPNVRPVRWRRAHDEGGGFRRPSGPAFDLGRHRMIERSFTIVEAPSVLGLFPKGVETLADALVAVGLAERLGARRAGRVEPLPYEPERDPVTLLLNPRGIVDYAVALADAVGAVVDRGEFPVVLGGDCSILLGNLLALRRRGRYGLLFLDGHADFYQPEAEPNGEAASMDLALATGRGPAVVTDIEGRCPLVRDEDVVVFGRRDAADAEAHGSQRIEDTAIAMTDLAAMRAAGVEAAAANAAERLSRTEFDGFWIHLDADVLDDAVMPAVDYRLPDGLSWDELAAVLRAGISSGRAVGINVTIFNPKLDRDGSIALAFMEALARGLKA